MSSISSGAVFHTYQKVYSILRFSLYILLTLYSVTNGKVTAVEHFDSKGIVEDYIRSLNVPATYLQLGIFMHYTVFQLQPVGDPSAKSYKIALPVPRNVKYPLIDVNEDTGKYVKAILLNREKVLGKVFQGAVKQYPISEVVDIVKNVGGLDVVFEQCSEEAYRSNLAAAGVPEFFRNDMVDTMRFLSEYHYFDDVAVEEGHKVRNFPPRTSTFGET